MSVRTKLMLAFFLLLASISEAAKVDTIPVFSSSMNRQIYNAVVLPYDYDTTHTFPVVYLLHGLTDNYSAWLTLPPNKQLLSELADRYGYIIVCPDGGYRSFYLNSPVDKNSQYETYITKELIPYVDKIYKTIPARKGRFITGLSMGGHGALYLAIRNPDLFQAAGSISGVLDLTRKQADWITKEMVKVLGDPVQHADWYKAHSVYYQTNKLKASGLRVILDCGLKDFLYDINREFHKKCLDEAIAHDYIERPGQHSWTYFSNALEYHLVFFKKATEGRN